MYLKFKYHATDISDQLLYNYRIIIDNLLP